MKWKRKVRSQFILVTKRPGLPDFSWYKYTKAGKNMPNDEKIPNAQWA
jgi:hypothetical protein